jgi:hypothetical protein
LLDQLRTLQTPKNDYQIELPSLELPPSSPSLPLDSEDLLHLQKLKHIAHQQQNEKLRSLAVQKNLPRPILINDQIAG